MKKDKMQTDESIAEDYGDTLYESRNEVTREAFRMIVLNAIKASQRLYNPTTNDNFSNES